MSSSLFSYDTLIHAIAGSTGSVVGMAVFYPLDTLRSRLQDEDSDKFTGSLWKMLLQLANEEGIESWYCGLSSVLQSLSVSSFVYFYSFHGLRSKFSTKNNSAIQDLVFGMIAGSINVLITSPLWVVNTRMKLKKNVYDSLSKGLIEISRKEGFRSLWSGILPSLLLVSNPAIQFMVYEYIKRHVSSKRQFDTYTAFVVGAFAKTIATTLTYPLQLIQSRLRAGSSLKPLLANIESDPLLLFRGLKTKLLHTVMTAALMFLVYEKVVRLILTIMRVRLTKH